VNDPEPSVAGQRAGTFASSWFILKGSTVSTSSLPGSAEPVFLRPEVKLEPLVCRWHAWPHLIAPAQLALHLAQRIVPLLQSFASNPGVHVAANSDPAMFGGPFVSLALDDVDAVRALLARIEQECGGLLQLAADLRALDAMLQEGATGFTLNEYYARLPGSLQGLVELLYDLHHRPTVRLLETMLHAEDLATHTQEIALRVQAEGDRAFFMSTPRLPAPDEVCFRIPFADPRLDLLAAARTSGQDFDRLAAAFDVTGAARERLRACFTTTAPAARTDRDYTEGGVRLRYFGHACVLFQSAATTILFDPFFSVEPGTDGRLTLHDLPDRIDYVVLTHTHQDHFSAEMLLQLRPRIGRFIVPANNSGNLADPSMKLILRQLGCERVDVLEALDQVAVPGGVITSLPFTGEHADLAIHSKQAIALTLEGRRFLFRIDSDGRDPVLYRKLMRLIGPVDALFIGMECDGAPLNWLYEPLLGKPVNRRNNESRRLSGADAARAWQIQEEVRAPVVYVYAMGQEPWRKYIMGLQYAPDSIQLTESDRFVDQCRAAGVDACRLYGSHERVFAAHPASPSPSPSAATV
jgi:L-ascorbate metabolism protein UlaG (beta-lactamase superfamily)